MKKKGLMTVYRAMLLLFTLFLVSCGGKQWTPEPVSDPKLDATYLKVLVLPVGIGAQFVKDYSQAAVDCRDGVLEGLNETKRFQVNPIDAAPAKTVDRQTLLVNLEITDVRIASTAARFWAGSYVGSSYITVKLTLTDGHTGQAIRDKIFSTQNNAEAASWALGYSDRSIAKDMGRIIGDYITAVVP